MKGVLKMLTTIFYHVDNFCNEILQNNQSQQLPIKKKASGPNRKMHESEIITICLYFHYSGFRNFKTYYLWHIQGTLKSAFPRSVSYNRFTELIQENLMLLALIAYASNAASAGINFIDSTAISVCHNARISGHKVFKKLAKRGKTTTGWFFGFKLHIVINHLGQIIAFTITPGNVDDRNKHVIDMLTKNLFGKLVGDRGYLSAELFEALWERGIKLITRIRQNMKNKLMDMEDKFLLKSRGMIESVNNLLKNALQLEHTRHRSEAGFFANIFSTIAAYSFYENKPSLTQADGFALPVF